MRKERQVVEERGKVEGRYEEMPNQIWRKKKKAKGRRDEVSQGVMSNGGESDEAPQMTHHISTQQVDGGLNNVMR